MLTTSYLFLQLWATFATKLMKRPPVFFNYFKTSTSFLHVYKISWSANKKKKMLSVAICELNLVCFIPATLNSIFHKNYEKPYNFCNVFLKLHSVLCHAVLSLPHFYNKNDGRFSIANKLLFISKGIFFTLCF